VQAKRGRERLVVLGSCHAIILPRGGRQRAQPQPPGIVPENLLLKYWSTVASFVPYG
jgi:hypothetical protein